MAKMLIQGTDGGYKVFYPIEIGDSAFNPLTKDERSLFYTKDWLLYSVTMVGNGCVLSTYRYVLERRNDGTDGYVAFSFFLPDNSMIKKGEAKALLDELSESFFNKYVDEEDNNRLNQVPVSGCLYLESILDKYRFCGSNPILNQHQEKVSYAFIVCSDEKEVGDYLSNPFQDEYEPYKQVFFVEKRYRSCLLLPDTANLTGKIDLENPKYKLILRQNFSSSGIEVEVRANGKRKYNEDWVYRKEKLTITYSKEYSNSLILEGKITDAELQPYLEIDEDNRRIIVKRDVDLKSASKKVMIVVTDLKGRRVEDVEVKVLTQGVNPMRKSSEADGSFVFIGEELGETFTVAASKDGLSGAKTFIPNQIEENVISLTIQKRKVINITVKDDNDGSVLYNCDIKVEDKKSRVEKKTTAKDKTIYEFLGDEIDRNYLITISKYGYESKTVDLCPEKEDNSSVYYELKKKVIIIGSKQRYYLEVNPDKGSRGNCPDYIENVNGRNNCYPKAKKGYRFVSWEDHRDEPYKQCDGHFIAIFEETWWHKHKGKVLLAAIAVILVALIVLVISLVRGKNPKPPKNEETFAHVIDLIEDCGNNIDMLNALQDRWQQQKPDIMKTGGFLGIIGGTPDSTMYKAWAKGMEKIEAAIEEVTKKKDADEKLRQEVIAYVNGDELYKDQLKEYRNKIENDESLTSRIDSCIQLREWLNEGKIDEIKNYKFHYSTQQQPLINAINAIPNSVKSYVVSKMKSAAISKMSLNRIIEFVNKKIDEKNKQDVSDQPPGPNPNDTLKKTNTIEQLENEFWDKVHAKASKNDFDTFFGKTDWKNNKQSEVWKFYHTYLSWGTTRDDNKQNNDGRYNYYKGFSNVSTRDLQNCSTIEDLQSLVEGELNKVK